MSSSCERCQWVFTDILLSSKGHAVAEGSSPGGQNWLSCEMTLCEQAAKHATETRKARRVNTNQQRHRKLQMTYEVGQGLAYTSHVNFLSRVQKVRSDVYTRLCKYSML
jgi:hypothetical protein